MRAARAETPLAPGRFCRSSRTTSLWVLFGTPSTCIMYGRSASCPPAHRSASRTGKENQLRWTLARSRRHCRGRTRVRGGWRCRLPPHADSAQFWTCPRYTRCWHLGAHPSRRLGVGGGGRRNEKSAFLLYPLAGKPALYFLSTAPSSTRPACTTTSTRKPPMTITLVVEDYCFKKARLQQKHERREGWISSYASSAFHLPSLRQFDRLD